MIELIIHFLIGISRTVIKSSNESTVIGNQISVSLRPEKVFVKGDIIKLSDEELTMFNLPEEVVIYR